MNGTDANFRAPRAHQLCSHHNRFMRPRWSASVELVIKLFQILFTKTQVKVTEPWPQPQCPSPQFPWSLLPDAHPGHTKAVGDHSIGSLVFCYIVVLQGRVGETCQERFQVLWYVTYMCWSFEWNCISKQPHFSTHVFLTTCLCLQNFGQLGLHFDLQPLHGLETRNTSQHVRPSGSTRLKGWRVASSLLSGSLQFEASLLVHFQLVLSDLSYFSDTFFYHIYYTYLTSIFTSISLWRSVSLHICRHMYIYHHISIYLYIWYVCICCIYESHMKVDHLTLHLINVPNMPRPSHQNEERAAQRGRQLPGHFGWRHTLLECTQNTSKIFMKWRYEMIWNDICHFTSP